ncbi:hypothetical protein NX059_004503 [Plenodomus lindquistii]|nr:hypothetical protein NX059_004503 [Plenodomus lindquistii]
MSDNEAQPTPPTTQNNGKAPAAPKQQMDWKSVAAEQHNKLLRKESKKMSNRSILHPSTSPISKAVHKRASAIHGYRSSDADISSVRRHDVLWATEANWLKPMVYFVKNVLSGNEIALLLKSAGITDSQSKEFSERKKALLNQQAKWQHKLMTVFIFPLVGTIITTWEEAHPNDDFTALTANQRCVVWAGEYNKDPAGTSMEMWQPVTVVVDWSVIWHTAAGMPAETTAKINRVKSMLLAKCDCRRKEEGE